MRTILLAAVVAIGSASASEAQWVVNSPVIVSAPVPMWSPAPVWAPAPVAVTTFRPVVASPVVVAPRVVAPTTVVRTRYRPFRPFAGPVRTVSYVW